MKPEDLKGIGVVVALAIATAFVIRAYLDILRIKSLKSKIGDPMKDEE
mgnify:CR=1 FL=1|jgi:hypothetical protein